MVGTTINENNLVYKTIQKSIAKHNISISLDQVKYYSAGKEKQQAIYDILSRCTAVENREELSYRIYKKFKINLTQAYNSSIAQPFTGVEAFIYKLRQHGIKVCLNTGYNTTTTSLLLKQVNWEIGKTVDALVTADDVDRVRPYPDMIEKAMQILGVSNAQNVLKAGDSATDIFEGKNANCGFTVGVLTGAHTKSQLLEAQPDVILQTLPELYSLLQV